MFTQSLQMPKWPLNGKEIDFTGTNITVNNINSSLLGAKGSSNGYYDENNNLLFHIIDTKLFAPDGTFVDNLYTDEDNTPDEMGSEIIVFPAEPDDNCLYYVIYTMQQHNDDNTHVWKTCYNLVCWYGPTIVDSGVLNSMSGECHGAIAISDFITSNGNTYHRLETVGAGPLTNYGPNFFINGELRLVSQTVLPNTWGYDFCELEMSKDGKVLAAAHLNVDQVNNYSPDPYNITIWMLDDNFYPSVVYNDDIGEPNQQTEQFTGVEIYQDPLDPNDKSIYFNQYGGGKCVIFIINGMIYPNALNIAADPFYSRSHLELARDGRIYSTDGNQKLYYIDPTGTINPDFINIGTHNPIRNDYIESSHANAPIVYTLPDQVDQADYSAYTVGTEFDCCEAAHIAPFTTTMSGVSHASNGDITISGTVTWSTTSNPFTYGGNAVTDIYLKGDLTINAGARLNITGLTVHFKEGESLEMAYSTGSVAGPKLYLYSGSKLTVFDECDEDALWTGIDCNGWYGNGYEQTGDYPLLQPYVYMYNSTIEFAEKGIDVSCGGIVKAYESDFNNNIRDVKFASWQNHDNVSFFRRCDFITTQAIYDKGYEPIIHAEIWEAPGIIFYACDFENDFAPDQSITPSQWGTGIYATNSFLHLLPYGTTYGKMTNLYKGIQSMGGSSTTINKQNFTDCCKAVWLIDCPAITVTQNDFDLSPEALASNLYFDNFGLYIESSSGYQIEENLFHDGLTGIVVYNSGDANNFIYKNNFEDLTSSNTLSAVSIIALGDNTNYPKPLNSQNEGLHISCNNFDNVELSIAVLGGTLGTTNGQITVSTSDICQEQIYAVDQNNASITKIAAHNHFQNMPTTYSLFRYFLISTVSEILGDNNKYYYHESTSAGYQLGDYNQDHITVNTYADRTCPTQILLTKSSNISGLISQTEDFIQYESDLQTELDDLTSYNTLQMEASAQTANELNTSVVYNDLYEVSPNLTSEILLAYLNNINISQLSRTSLMLANSPLPTDVLQAVDLSDLSPEYKAYILKNQEGENPIEYRINQINGVKSARQVNYDHLMLATFSSDTTPEFADTYNQVLHFMESQTDLHASKRLLDMYMHKSMFEDALTELNDLESVALFNDDIALLNDIGIKRIRTDIMQTNIFEDAKAIVLKNEEYLRNIAADYNTKEGGSARVMLESVGLFENVPIVFTPSVQELTMGDKSSRISDESEVFIPELEALFSIYPNPADNFLSIEFINPDGACTFIIYGINGSLVKTVSTNQSLGFMSIDISQLEAGNYIITCLELSSSQNFMIVR